MNDSMRRLAQIAKVSLEIDSLQQELKNLPIHVEELQTRLNVIEGEYQSKKSEVEKCEIEERQLRSQVQDEEAQLKGKEERLNSLKTQKEFQAVSKEITIGKAANRERETRIAQLSSMLEEIKTALAPLESQVEELRGKLQSARGEIQGSLDEAQSKLKSLEASLKVELSFLPEDILSKYHRIQQKRSPAAAEVLGGTCQECFIHLPPQLFIEIQKKQEIHSCPSCHRLLYLNLD